jgi:hypothetical protein
VKLTAPVAGETNAEESGDSAFVALVVITCICRTADVIGFTGTIVISRPRHYDAANLKLDF